jgi:hypothetical protein
VRICPATIARVHAPNRGSYWVLRAEGFPHPYPMT